MDLWVDTDIPLELELSDDAGDPVTNATVEARVFEEDKVTEVDGVTWPVTLAHTADGQYEGTIPNTTKLTALTWYWVQVTAVAGGLQTRWKQAVLARDRPLQEN